MAWPEVPLSRSNVTRTFNNSALDPERGLDLLQVGQVHVEVPKLVGPLRLEAHRGDRAHHAHT